MSGYAEDLAHTHDVGYGDFGRRAAERIVEWLGSRRGVVVDLGCGAGQSSRVFTDAGFDVLGVDQSPALIERARARVPEARFEVGSFLDAELPRCVAAAAIGEVLTYTFDPRNGRAALAGLFGRIHGALVPGGLLVFDLLGPARQPRTERSWQEGAEWGTLVERAEGDGRLRRRIVHFRAVDGAWRRGEETHDVLLSRPSEVLADLRAAGLRARTRVGYDGRRAAPNHTVYVARRP